MLAGEVIRKRDGIIVSVYKSVGDKYPTVKVKYCWRDIFKKVYGRYPTDEELKVFVEYIRLVRGETFI